jgi:hypothetical protein
LIHPLAKTMRCGSDCGLRLTDERAMTTFKERETAHEAKFAHDQETAFKISARRNKLLGLWAADLMDLSGQAADDYAKEVIRSDFEEVGEEDVYRKVMGDLGAKDIDISEHRLRRKMSELLDVARQQLTTG